MAPAADSLILIAAYLVVMATAHGKPRRRPRRKYIAGAIDEDVSLTTIAAKDVIKSNFDQAVAERTLLSSIVSSYSLASFTKASGVGPIMVGIAHSDYTDAEIEEWIESTNSWDEGDLVAQEVAARKIRKIGVFGAEVSEDDTVVLNDGKPIKTKLNWVLSTGKTLSLWGYNMGISAVATTVPVIRAQGKANLWVL